MKAGSSVLSESKEKEEGWLSNVAVLVEKDAFETIGYLFWAAYHANRQPLLPWPIASIGLMPLFTESAHSPAMVKYAMNIIAKATQHVNNGQIPVITMDQPLFTIGKRIQ